MARRTALIRVCEYCGAAFGKERGPAAKTCSVECERARHSARERARYERIKGSEEFHATRKQYLLALQSRRQADPEFDQRFIEAHREYLRAARKRIAADPERLESYREKARAWHRNRSPEQRAQRRSWYQSLSPAERLAYLSRLRQERYEARAVERLNALVAIGNMLAKRDQK